MVTPQYIRTKFNEGKFWQRLQNGELTAVLKRNGHPSSPRVKLPTCTRSQLVVYLQGKKFIAMVHQYVLPNGNIGGSGKPDPKMLRVNGTLLRVIP